MVLTYPQFREIAERLGVEFASLGDSEAHAKALRDPDLWRPRRGLQIVMDQLFPDPLQSYHALAALADEDTVVISHPFAFGARLLQERYGIPCVTALLSPVLLRSDHRVPMMYGQRQLSKMAAPLKTLMWRLADRWLIDPAVLPRLNRARRKLAMKPISRPFAGWIFSPTLTIALFPEWFAPGQPDWPGQVRQTGFLRFQGGQPPSPILQDFLDQGDPPIVFTPGSGSVDAQDFFAVASTACRQLGRRAIFLSPTTGKISSNEGIINLPFAPLNAILPRCCAVVHHGGIGTTAAALYAGSPQIIRPFGFDQYDHGARIEELGMGVCLSRRDFAPSTLIATLGELLADHQVARRCQVRARQLSGHQAVAESCDLVEKHHG